MCVELTYSWEEIKEEIRRTSRRSLNRNTADIHISSFIRRFTTRNMNMTSEDRLKLVAQAGDINGLYSLLHVEPRVLENIDSIPLVDTPLHVAASSGHIQFATEIMRWKPSFGWKLNPQGFTPIQLALQNGHDRMAHRLVDINKDLVRAKGKEGLTPLHYVSESGECDLLVKFLSACPDSIEDVTVKSETALHIAVRHGQLESLQILVGWLRRTSQEDALQLEKRLLNWKDEEGNTILHVSARQNNLQMVELLVKTKVDLKAKNNGGSSALDLAPNEEIESILVRAGANKSVTDVSPLAASLKSKMTFKERIRTYIHRIASDVTEEQRNAYMIIAALVATSTYQGVLSPPGGLYQGNAGDDNLNTTTLNSTAIPAHKAGTSVLSSNSFFAISFINIISFLLSSLVLLILTPPGTIGTTMLLPIFYLTYSYLISMAMISPTMTVSFVSIVILVLLNFFLSLVMLNVASGGNKRIRGHDITYCAAGKKCIYGRYCCKFATSLCT